MAVSDAGARYIPELPHYGYPGRADRPSALVRGRAGRGLFHQPDVGPRHCPNPQIVRHGAGRENGFMSARLRRGTKLRPKIACPGRQRETAIRLHHPRPAANFARDPGARADRPRRRRSAGFVFRHYLSAHTPRRAQSSAMPLRKRWAALPCCRSSARWATMPKKTIFCSMPPMTGWNCCPPLRPCAANCCWRG